MYRLLFLSLLLSASRCQREAPQPAPLSWQSDRVMTHLSFIAQEPHPLGSARQKEVAVYIEQQAKQMGLETVIDAFQASVPDPEVREAGSIRNPSFSVQLQNVYAKLIAPGKPCVLLLGSHYDSKRLESEISLGANDSGSSSAVLLELMRGLKELSKTKDLRCSVMAIWFDGEEAYLHDWHEGEVSHPAKQVDHLYGSRHLAGRLSSCKQSSCLPKELGGEEVIAFVLLDMIGMPNVRLTPDLNSDPRLLAAIRNWDEKLFKGRLYGNSRPQAIADDHIPFRERNIPVLDIIDFENLSTWHTSNDRPETLSAESMQKVATLTFAFLQELLSKEE